MKKLILLTVFLCLRANATGCLGGDWTTISKETLPPTEVLTGPYYGEPVDEVNVWEGGAAYIKITNVGTRDQRLEFVSGMFSRQKIDLIELLLKLRKMSPSLMAETEKKIEVNRSYDDCQDIPENTRLTTMTYRFQIKMDNGEVQKFQADVETYDPPLPQ